MRISDWSSDVCSSDLPPPAKGERHSRASVPALVLLCSRGQADEALANINGPPVKVEPACIEAIGLEGTHRRSQARQRSIASPTEIRTRPSHRSEESRGGKACVSPCSERGSPYN